MLVSRPGPLAALLLLTSCSGQPALHETADIVLTGGTVWTMDPSQPKVEAVAIRGDSIVYVGEAAGASTWIGEDTEVLEIGEGMVLPGFQDSHTHVLEGGMGLADCDLSSTTDASEVLATVAQCAERTSASGWLRGGGFQLTFFPDGNPMSRDLDAIVGDRPALLTSSDAHSAWVSSAALEAAGITAETPDPPAGRIERDPVTGEPTGTLRERAIDLVAPLLPPRTRQERIEGLRRGLEMARQYGITGFQDANLGADDVAAYSDLASRGELTARASLSLTVDPDKGPSQVAELVALRERYPAGLLRVGSAKLFVDGVIEAQTAALLEPYVGKGDFAGYLEMAPSSLDEIVAELDRQGFQVHIHAIGDRGIRVSLDALAEARARNGRRDARHHLAHIQLWSPEDIPRMRDLEVAANFQPLWAYADPFITELTEPYLGPERSRWLYPIHSLAEAGARLVFGSDWDVSSMNPLLGIEVGVTRQDPNDPQSPVWLPDERVDLETMLAGYTIDGAWLGFLESQTGSIEVGKAADLVLLNRDLFTIPPQEIGDALVTLTLFDGSVVYRATP